MTSVIYAGVLVNFFLLVAFWIEETKKEAGEELSNLGIVLSLLSILVTFVTAILVIVDIWK